MNKQLILSTHCNTDGDRCSESPVIFAMEITPELKNQIKHLATVVQNNNAMAITVSCNGGMWSDLLIAGTEFDKEDIGSLINQIEDNQVRTDVHVLKITSKNFSFSATPKHHGSSQSVFTNNVPVVSLDNNNIFVAIDDLIID